MKPLNLLPAAIKLGDLNLTSATPLNDVLWFIAGLVLLTGTTFLILWWTRQTRPDPFI